MQALILAGGLGTRLREVVKDRPKPMALVNGKPFLQYQLEFLRKYGYTDIILSIGYLADQVINFFDDGSSFGVKVKYVIEKEPLGTGGAIKNALSVLDSEFLIMNGDSIILIDLSEVRKFHLDNKSDFTMVLSRINDKENRYGQVKVVDDRIVGYGEKAGSRLKTINAGIYLARKNTLQLHSFNAPFSLEKDVFPTLLQSNNILAFRSKGYFIDIGVPADFLRIQNEVSYIERFLTNE